MRRMQHLLWFATMCVLAGCTQGEPIPVLNQAGTYWGCGDRSCTGFEPSCIGCSFVLAFYDGGSGAIHRKTDGTSCGTSLEQTTWHEGASSDEVDMTTSEGLVLISDIQVSSETQFYASYTDGATSSIECNLATGQPQ